MRGIRSSRVAAIVAAIIFGCAGLVSIGAAGPAAAGLSPLPGYTPLVPVRICDTRAAGSGVLANQCDGSGHTPLTAGGVLTIAVAGAAGVPSDATAVVLHVTTTAATAVSYLTVWPTGQTQPTAANMTWTPGQSIPALVQTGVGTGNDVSIYNLAGSVDVIVDLEGYFEVGTGGLFTPINPVRACDTRAGQPVTQCNNGAAGTLGQGQTKQVNVMTGFGVPSGATAVALNVTVTGTNDFSYLDVWPQGDSMPLAAALIWNSGQTISNRVITGISPAGNIEVYNANGDTDVVIDIDGYFLPGTGGGYFAVNPTRVCDTRPIGPGVASNICNNSSQGSLQSGFALVLSTSDTTETAIVANVSVTNTASVGYLTVFPDDDVDVPLAADLVWAHNQTISNLAIADLGSTSTMDYFNGGPGNVDVIIDEQGFYSATVPAGASRLGAAARTGLTARRSKAGTHAVS